MKLDNLLSKYKNYISAIGKIKSQKLVVDIIWNAAFTGIVKLRGFIIAPIISYFCGLEWYGAWILIYSITRYTLPFSTLILTNAIVKFFPEENEETRDKIYLFCLLNIFSYSILISLLLAVNARFLSVFLLKETYFTDLLFVGSFLTIPVSLERILGGYFRARDNIKVSSAIETVTSLIEVVSITLTLAMTRNLVLAAVVFLVTSLIMEIIIAIKIINFRTLSTAFSKAILVKYWKYVKYSLPLVSGSLTEIFASNGDRFIVAYFLGAEPVGIYSIAYALGSSSMIFCGPIVYSLFPKVSRLWASGNTIEARSLLWKSTKAFLIGGAIFFVILLVFGNQLLLALAGERTGVLEYNGLTVSLIVTLGILFYGSARIQSLYLLLVNATKELSIVEVLFNVVFNFAFNIIFIPKLGILGAALATLATYMIALIFVIYFIRRSESREITANTK